MVYECKLCGQRINSKYGPCGCGARKVEAEPAATSHNSFWIRFNAQAGLIRASEVGQAIAKANAERGTKLYIGHQGGGIMAWQWDLPHNVTLLLTGGMTGAKEDDDFCDLSVDDSTAGRFMVSRYDSEGQCMDNENESVVEGFDAAIARALTLSKGV